MAVWLPPPPPAIIWQQKDAPVWPGQAGDIAFTCDENGVIRCSVTETVTANRSLEDMRIIAKYVSLVSERNRRFYISWKEKLPSAAFEVVRRIHQFPYLPYGDMYAISDMHLFLDEGRNRIVVRYPREPEKKRLAPLAEDEYVIYETNLANFMKAIEKELPKLKKFEKRQLL